MSEATFDGRALPCSTRNSRGHQQYTEYIAVMTPQQSLTTRPKSRALQRRALISSNVNFASLSSGFGGILHPQVCVIPSLSDGAHTLVWGL